MILKRVFDVSVIVIFSPIILPVFLVVSLVVYFKIGSPIFFKQERPGKKGDIFVLYKFRTMAMEETNSKGVEVSRESRVLPVGSFLRKTGLDELPELFNVLKGEMSLVGPRPLLVSYLSLYSEFQNRRHEVLPGITGWAQINGRNEVTWPERLKMDVWYVDSRSFLLDIKIIFLTIFKIVKKDKKTTSEKFIKPFKGER